MAALTSCFDAAGPGAVAHGLAPSGQVQTVVERYVEGFARLHPVEASCWGITGHDAEMTDYSPAGFAARADHDRATLVALRGAPRVGQRERIAAEVLAERLGLSVELYEAGEWLRELRILFSPLQAIRGCFDLMATDTAEDCEAVVERMAAVPGALAGFRATLAQGVATGVVAARRQALACAEQAATWGGARHGTPPFFTTVVSAFAHRGFADTRLAQRLEVAAAAASDAYAATAVFLADVYAPAAEPGDGIGAERYARYTRASCGMDLDLADVYAWGLDELRRIESEMVAVAARIAPGRPMGAVLELLERDPARSIEGPDAFCNWLQERMDAAIDSLDGSHFDIPAPLRRLQACLAPPGGAAAMYYTPPSEDFTRPGRTWYPAGDQTRFPLWRELSTAYHEGVPGHHLQLGTVRHLGAALTRFQRTLAYVPGHGEGWALYAERLMAELGYYERPEFELGRLAMESLRAARVVVDIGLHLELPLPAARPTLASHRPRWSAGAARRFLAHHAFLPGPFVASEVDRYLGLPGQAISYKVGERVWLECREAARRRMGGAFDAKAFHAGALELGPMGLDQLRRELIGSPVLTPTMSSSATPSLCDSFDLGHQQSQATTANLRATS